MDRDSALASLRLLIAHLVDHGAIELGTPQSKALIECAKALGAYDTVENNGTKKRPKRT